MNKEINTIIDSLEGCIGMFDYMITPIESNLLVSYIRELQQENKQLKDNWNELKEWVNKHYDYYMNNEDYIGGRLCFTDIKNKMEEMMGGDK